MAKALKALLVLSLLVCAPLAIAGPGNVSGTYETWVFGSKVKALVQQQGNNISGVAYIYRPFGKKSTYHFNGRIDKGRVVASHFQGHVFHGRVDGRGRLQGVITTRKGHRISISAPRR